MRAVVDVNVIVSGLLVRAGAPGQVLDAGAAGEFELVTSPALLAELEDVLSRPRIARRISVDDARSFVERLAAQSVLVVPEVVLAAVQRDPDDNRILEAAVAGGADVVVSGDKDLLSLEVYEDIPIVAPARFLELLAG